MKLWQLAYFLPLLVLVLPFAKAIGDVGLGISDFEARATFSLNSQGNGVEVAQLVNTGLLNLTITGHWISTDDKTLEVEFVPSSPFLLVSGESITVYAKVVEAELGVYVGKIEFVSSPNLPDTYTGNSAAPGGTAHATFTITDVAGNVSNTAWPFPMYYLAVPAFAVPFSVGLGLYMRRRKHTPTTLPKIVDVPVKHGKFSRGKKRESVSEVKLTSKRFGFGRKKMETFEQILAGVRLQAKTETNVQPDVPVQTSVNVEAAKVESVKESGPSHEWIKAELQKLTQMLWGQETKDG